MPKKVVDARADSDGDITVVRLEGNVTLTGELKPHLIYAIFRRSSENIGNGHVVILRKITISL